MKATGIVRKIDDLGRVAIPKEIRRALGMNEGDCLEIFTEDNKVIFEKYENESPFSKVGKLFNEIKKELEEDGDGADEVLCYLMDEVKSRLTGLGYVEE